MGVTGRVQSVRVAGLTVKELRDTWWKVLVAAVPVALMAAAYLPPYQTTEWGAVQKLPARTATEQLLNIYEGGGIALALLAALLGAGALSGDTNRDTILLLLSKPVSRARVLMAEYAACAGILLAAAVLGHALLLAIAVAKGYPFAVMSFSGVVLSTGLLWLGSLFVLGVALLVSVAFRRVLASAAIAVLISASLVYAPGLMSAAYAALSGDGGDPTFHESMREFDLFYYWTDRSLYFGEVFAVTNFVVCLIAAVLPLLAALLFFRRRAY